MRITLDGKKCFQEYKEALRGAEKSIWICMYMIRFDDYTKQIWDILDEKHKQGVNVRVIYDLYGCFRSLPRLVASPFTKAFIPKWYLLNRRNHAKLMIIDKKLGVVSGRNFTRRYYDEWVDTSTFLDKPEEVDELVGFSERVEQEPVDVMNHDGVFMITDPVRKNRGYYNFCLEHIVKSKREIFIASPYFVIDDALENLLKAAADRGVRVVVIVPAKPEHKLASTFNRINFQRIHHRNVVIKRSKGMFHSKVMLFDDVAVIGSANFDNRSFKWNYELSLVPDDEHLRLIRRHLHEVADHSVRYNWMQRAYDALLYAFMRHLMEFL